MTHILVLQGTPSGGPLPKGLTLTTFQNVSTFDSVLLQYVNSNTLHLDRFVNVSTSDDVELENVIVTELTLTTFTNTNSSDDVVLTSLPFEAVNDETTDLLAEFTGTYTTSRKIQIDAFITALKSAGTWALLDWFECGKLTVNEHDALINWVNPAQSLVKAGTPVPVYTSETGWAGGASTQSGHLKSGWNPTTGPNATTTSMTLFAKSKAVSAENNLQLAGNFEFSTPGPAAPVGTWIILYPATGNWTAGANCNAFDGVTGAALATADALFAVTRDGSGTITASVDGVSAGTDATAGHFERTSADGLSLVGTPTGYLAGRSFPGTLEYAGWGAALSLAQLAGIVDAFADALLPPSAGGSGGADGLDSGDGDYLAVDDDGDWLQIIP